MRYHHDKTTLYFNLYGQTYKCDHPAYTNCTLYLKGGIGLAVIQQRYDCDTKKTWWSEIDPWLTDELYLHSGFADYFNRLAASPTNGLYPTVTIRQIMWSLRIKPLKKEKWETTFDKSPI